MKDVLIYKTKVSWAFHILLLIISLPFSVAIDYNINGVFFTSIVYYLILLIPLFVFILISLFSYTCITLFKSGIEIKSFFLRARKFIVWSNLEKIEITFSRFAIMTIVYKRKQKTIKETCFFTYVSRKDLNNIAYLLHAGQVNIECRGAISKDWKKEAIKKYQGVELQIESPLSVE